MSEDLFILNVTIKDKPITIDLNEVLCLDNFFEQGFTEAEMDLQIMKLGHTKMLLLLAWEETKAWRRRLENDIEEFKAEYAERAEAYVLSRRKQQVEDKERTLSSVTVSRADLEDAFLSGALAPPDDDPDGNFDPTEYTMMREKLVKLLEKEGILQGSYDTVCSRSVELLSVAKRFFKGEPR